MALVKELEENGCKIRASKICKYVNGEVQRCVNCEYKQYTPEQTGRLVASHYIDTGLMEEYPIELSETPGECALCNGQKNPASSKVYCEITNTDMDVKRDLAGAAQKENGGGLLLEADCCDECEKNIKKARFMNSFWATFTVVLVVAINALIARFFFTSVGIGNLFILLGLSLVGYAFYHFMAKASYNKICQRTHLHILDVPKLKGMKEKGFYVHGQYKFLPSYMDKRQEKQLAKNSR